MEDCFAGTNSFHFLDAIDADGNQPPFRRRVALSTTSSSSALPEVGAASAIPRMSLDDADIDDVPLLTTLRTYAAEPVLAPKK